MRHPTLSFSIAYLPSYLEGCCVIFPRLIQQHPLIKNIAERGEGVSFKESLTRLAMKPERLS